MLFIAEIGLNHEGNFDLALEIVRQAKLAGADVAKFQFGWRSKTGELNEIGAERGRALKDWCDHSGIEMLASVFTEEGYKLAQDLGLARYKVASRTVVDDPALCSRVLKEGKETFVSLGMWQGEGWPFGEPTDRLHYLYCRSKYPSHPRDLNLMPASFGGDGYVGYSDHALGISACLLAIARGATVIEKHFTLNKASQVIRDHTLSATPDEFRRLVEEGGQLARLVSAMGQAGTRAPA